MSHIAEVAMTEMQDLDALKDAVESKGGIWKQDQKQHHYYSGTSRCDHAFGLPGVNYEVGVNVGLDGKIKLAFDNYGYEGSGGRHDGHKLEAAFGRQMSGLKQPYSAAITVRELRRKGYRVTTFVQEDGKIRVKASR